MWERIDAEHLFPWATLEKAALRVSPIAFAQSDGYFGLTNTTSVEERLDMLDEEVAMRTTSAGIPSAVMKGEMNPEDGHEYIEFPSGSGNWFIRSPGSSEWAKWEN